MASFTLGNVPSAVGRYTMPRQDFNVGGFSPAPVGQPNDPRTMPQAPGSDFGMKDPGGGPSSDTFSGLRSIAGQRYLLVCIPQQPGSERQKKGLPPFDSAATHPPMPPNRTRVGRMGRDYLSRAVNAAPGLPSRQQMDTGTGMGFDPNQPFIPPAIAKDPTKPGNFIDPGTGQPYAGGTSNQTGQVTLGGVPAPAGGGGFFGNIQRIIQALQQNPQLLQQLRQQGGAAAMQQPGVFGNVARAVSAAPAIAAGTPQAASGMGAPNTFMQQYGPQMQAMYPQVAPDGTNGMPPMTGSGYGGGTQRPAQPQQPFPMF